MIHTIRTMVDAGRADASCVFGFIFHLLKQGGSIEERKEVSSGGLSEWQINWQHLQNSNTSQQARPRITVKMK